MSVKKHIITYIILYLDCDINFAQGSINVKRDMYKIKFYVYFDKEFLL